MNAAEWFAIIAVLVGATAQSITGIGFALVCAPLLVLSLGPIDGVTLVNILGVSLSLFVLLREWRYLSIGHAAALFVPAAQLLPWPSG